MKYFGVAAGPHRVRLRRALVGILHGCLTHHVAYDESIAWGYRPENELTKPASHFEPWDVWIAHGYPSSSERNVDTIPQFNARHGLGNQALMSRVKHLKSAARANPSGRQHGRYERRPADEADAGERAGHLAPVDFQIPEARRNALRIRVLSGQRWGCLGLVIGIGRANTLSVCIVRMVGSALLGARFSGRGDLPVDPQRNRPIDAQPPPDVLLVVVFDEPAPPALVVVVVVPPPFGIVVVDPAGTVVVVVVTGVDGGGLDGVGVTTGALSCA